MSENRNYLEEDVRELDRLAAAGASLRAALANDMRNERMKEAAPEMFAELRRVAGWLDRLAAQAETQAKDLRFTSLAEACAADAKNYRKTRDIIMSLINKVDGKI